MLAVPREIYVEDAGPGDNLDSTVHGTGFCVFSCKNLLDARSATSFKTSLCSQGIY